MIVLAHHVSTRSGRTDKVRSSRSQPLKKSRVFDDSDRVVKPDVPDCRPADQRGAEVHETLCFEERRFDVLVDSRFDERMVVTCQWTAIIVRAHERSPADVSSNSLDVGEL